jgi:hypothetical protein
MLVFFHFVNDVLILVGTRDQTPVISVWMPSTFMVAFRGGNGLRKNEVAMLGVGLD